LSTDGLKNAIAYRYPLQDVKTMLAKNISKGIGFFDTLITMG